MLRIEIREHKIILEGENITFEITAEQSDTVVVKKDGWGAIVEYRKLKDTAPTDVVFSMTGRYPGED